MPSRASFGGSPHPPDRRDVRRRDPAVPLQAATAPSIGKFIIVLRTSTERPEAGCARVMGFDATAIHEEMLHLAGKGRPSQEHPYGTGDAARRIVDALEGFLGRQPPSS